MHRLHWKQIVGSRLSKRASAEDAGNRAVTLPAHIPSYPVLSFPLYLGGTFDATKLAMIITNWLPHKYLFGVDTLYAEFLGHFAQQRGF